LGRKTTFSYASTGAAFLTSVTDFRNRTVSFSWDSKGHLLSRTRPTVNGGTATSSATYDATYSQLTSATDELGKTTTVGLTAQGLPQPVTAPYGPVTQFLYNTAGQVTQATDPAGGDWSTAYNASGYPTSSTNPASQTTTRTFDGAGRLTQLTDAL